jgi:hypothetical protein
VAVVPANVTSFEITGRLDGEYAYRVHAVYTDGSTTAASNVEEIEVAGAGSAAGRVPALLTVDKSGDDITLQWADSCVATDTDYAVYEGTLGDFTSHVSRVCTTGGATAATLPPAEGLTYYLVVPRNAGHEGSYGKTSDGVERPAAASSCLPQAIGACD